MKRILLLILLVLPLSACTRSTLLTFQVDVASFIPQTDRSGSISYVSGDLFLYLPPDTTTGSVDAPHAGYPVSGSQLVTQALTDAELSLTLTLTSSADATLSIGLYIEDASDATQGNVFDSPEVAAFAANLVASTPETVGTTFILDSVSQPRAWAAIESGDFRVGLRVHTNTSSASVTETLDFSLDALDVVIKGSAEPFFPF